MIEEKENGNGDLAHGIPERLTRRFGLGAKPDARRRLYRRLQLAVEVHGQRAFVQLRTVAAEAAAARKPDRYFCHVALVRLREQGLMELGEL